MSREDRIISIHIIAMAIHSWSFSVRSFIQDRQVPRADEQAARDLGYLYSSPASL
jgi:hypothetical protein